MMTLKGRLAARDYAKSRWAALFTVFFFKMTALPEPGHGGAEISEKYAFSLLLEVISVEKQIPKATEGRKQADKNR